jgi:hypothetical protein
VAGAVAGAATLAYADWIQAAIVQAAAAFGLGAAAAELIASAVAEPLHVWLRWMTGAGAALAAGAFIVWYARRSGATGSEPAGTSGVT